MERQRPLGHREAITLTFAAGCVKVLLGHAEGEGDAHAGHRSAPHAALPWSGPVACRQQWTLPSPHTQRGCSTSARWTRGSLTSSESTARSLSRRWNAPRSWLTGGRQNALGRPSASDVPADAVARQRSHIRHRARVGDSARSCPRAGARDVSPRTAGGDRRRGAR